MVFVLAWPPGKGAECYGGGALRGAGDCQPEGLRLRSATSKQSFPQQARLLEKADFDRVFKSARLVVRRPPFLLLGVGTETARARLGIAVPKRLLPMAVDRNLIKRLCREQFRKVQARLLPLDIVLLCKSRPPCPLDRQYLNQQLTELFSQLIKQHRHHEKNRALDS